jgi:hypothetical protein
MMLSSVNQVGASFFAMRAPIFVSYSHPIVRVTSRINTGRQLQKD